MPHCCRAHTEASSAADFYPTVKAALHHESVNSEEDCMGLGWDLGQGLWLTVFVVWLHELNRDISAVTVLDKYMDRYTPIKYVSCDIKARLHFFCN